jgi:hypothetical protein
MEHDDVDGPIWGNVVTNERLAKGDLDISLNSQGWIRSANVRNASIMSRLAEQGVLEDWQVNAGLVFLDMKRYFSRRSGYRPNPIYALEFFSTSNTGIIETIYLVACRELQGMQERLVLEALHDPNAPMDFSLTVRPRVEQRHRADYQAAFEALAKALDYARKEVAERLKRENACAEDAFPVG